MHGRGFGDDIGGRRDRAAWIAAGLSPSLRWLSRRHVGAHLGFEGLVILRRPSFVIGDGERLCCNSAVAAVLVGGVSFGN